MHHRGHRAGELEIIHQRHCEILDAVAAGAEQRAMALVGEHIQTSQRERLDEFDHWERENSLRDSIPVFLDMFASPGE